MKDYCITYETPDGRLCNFCVSGVANEDGAIDRFRRDRALQIKYRGSELEIVQVSTMSKVDPEEWKGARVKNMNYTKGLMRRHEN
jgi:uncharacterized radical SAM superfamily Fe-S cluster-containing enzyme